MKTRFNFKGRLSVIVLSALLLVMGAQAHASTLQKWLNNTVENNPSVLAASSALSAAKFNGIAADQAVYNPEFEIDTESIENVSTTTVGISQTIDWGDERAANRALANANKVIANQSLAMLKRKTAHEALVALSQVHTLTALKHLAVQRLNLMERFKKTAKERFAYGDLSTMDVDLAKLSYAQARFDLASASADLVVAQQTLIVLTGRNVKDTPNMPAVFPSPTKYKQSGEQVVQKLPAMLKALAAVKLAQANVKVQASQGVVNPTIALRAGREESDDVIGLTLSFPLQVRNNYSAQVDSANEQMIQSEQEAAGVHRQLYSQLEVAKASYELSREAWLFWEASGAGTLQQQIVLLERLWKAGELSTGDSLLQLKQTLETSGSAITQRGRLWSDWSEWLRATGKIEQWLLKTAEDEK